MDKTAFEDQVLLGDLRKCSSYSTVLCITAYCLVAIVAEDLKTGRSTYEMLQVIGISLLDKTPVNELLKSIEYKDIKELNYNQLSLSLF